nr:hypothetical protein [Armatimonas sp.]
MDPTLALVESILALSRHLRNALEQNHIDLISTLLTERQRLLRTLGEVLQAGLSLSDELERSLHEADSILHQTAQEVKDSLGRELSVNQEQQRVANAYRNMSPSSFLDQLS